MTDQMAADDGLDIPAFLRVENRHLLPEPALARPKSTPLRQPRRRYFRGVPVARNLDTAGLELLADLKKRDRQRQHLRLKMLKERRP